MSNFVNTIDVIGDNRLTDSIIDKSVSEYKDNETTLVGDYAFYNCDNLTIIDIPHATSVGANAFYSCDNLSNVSLPLVATINDGAFDDCTAITSIELPSVTSLGTNAFNGCTGLSNINMPLISSVGALALESTSLSVVDLKLATSIGNYAFRYSSNLKAVVIRNMNSICSLGVSAFDSTKIAYGTGYIYVPRTLLYSYKTSNNWSTYSDNFRILEEWTVDGTVTGALDIENRHMVRFFNSDGTLLGYQIVATGGTATYNGTPVYPDDSTWQFRGFLPVPTNVTEDMDCYAQYTEPFSLETASWARISEISASGDAANYMNVGDTKSVYLNGTIGTLALDATYYVYILGLNHNSELEGSGIHFGCFLYDSPNDWKADLVHCPLADAKYGSRAIDGTKYFNMNHWGAKSHGGWARCDLRYDILGSTNVAPQGYGAIATSGQVGYDPTGTCATNPVAGTLMSCLPSELRAVMKPITKYTDNIGGNGVHEISASQDYLPLLAEYEVYGVRSNAQVSEQNYQKQYDYYSNRGVDDTFSGGKYFSSRSPRYNYDNYFCGLYRNESKNVMVSESVCITPIFMV